MKAVADEWSGVHCGETEYEDISWSDLQKLINRLDARKYTMVIISPGEDNNLTIGGGGGQYVVVATTNGDRFFEVSRDLPGEKSTVLLNVGGQEGDYPAEMIVDEVTATACAMTYLRSGTMDDRFTWREM